MINKINDPWGKIDSCDLREVEKELNVELPDSIKKFYLANNGGEPERYIFIEDECEYMLNIIYPLIVKNDEYVSVVKVYKNTRAILPDWFIPMGDDGGDGLYGFSMKENERGAIYYWCADYDYGETVDDYLIYLGESIEVLLEKMIEE